MEGGVTHGKAPMNQARFAAQMPNKTSAQKHSEVQQFIFINSCFPELKGTYSVMCHITELCELQSVFGLAKPLLEGKLSNMKLCHYFKIQVQILQSHVGFKDNFFGNLLISDIFFLKCGASYFWKYLRRGKESNTIEVHASFSKADLPRQPVYYRALKYSRFL